MKCIENIDDIKLNTTVVTVGKFDGLHKGHGKLIDMLKEKSEGKDVVVLTFAAKPIDVINNSKSKTIVTEKEKRLLCELKGVDYYISLPLTKEFLDLSPEAFIRDVLIDKLDMNMIVCGPDFTFGKFGAGDTKLLQKMGRYYGYEVIVVEKEKYKDKDIGSTGIRAVIAEGNIEMANEMLGHPYSVIGKVEEGKKLGRNLGFPTANIITEDTKLLPPNGVYRTILCVDGKEYNAITNVGVNPTVETQTQIKVETHVLEEMDTIYKEIIEVKFYEYIRPEKKFDNVEQLKKQVAEDIEQVKKSIAQNHTLC